MRELLQVLMRRRRDDLPTAVCRLVETRGSTPQKAGALMLVFPDGGQAGTLGGGCVEAEVKRRALGVLHEGPPCIVPFQLDSDYGWDDGLICGGRMMVLIDPIRNDQDVRYYEQVLTQLESGMGCQEAVAFDAEKSGLPAASSYLFAPDGRRLAANPTANLADKSPTPDRVERNLLQLSARPRPKAVEGVAYLPELPRCRLIIVGAGHVGQAVADWAAQLDFDVWIVDDRVQYANSDRFPRVQRVIVGAFEQTLPSLEVTSDTYCLIVTRGHNHDEEALHHLIDRGARYLGMIGSRRKIRLIFDDLAASGTSPELLAQVHAPVGIDIGSQTVPEIAVSILAELIAHRNLNGLVPGRPQPLSAAVADGPNA